MKIEDIPWFLGGKCKLPVQQMPGVFSKPYLNAFRKGELIPANPSILKFYETDKKFILK
jgi:hypothetical protein